MKVYTRKTEADLIRVVCNQCGKELKKNGQRIVEDWVSVEKTWGYFSGKDGQRHSFDLCEDCYDKLVKGFVLPVDEKECETLL